MRVRDALSSLALSVRTSLENPGVPLSSPEVARLFGVTPGVSGVSVDEAKAIGAVPAVYRAVAILAGVSASVPLKIYSSPFEEIKTTVLADPNPLLTEFELRELLYLHLALWGNGYQLKVRDGRGKVTELWPWRPDRVDVGKLEETSDGRVVRRYTYHPLTGGGDISLTTDQVLHVRGLSLDGVTGLSPIGVAKESLGVGLAAERYGASVFGRDAMISGFLRTDKQLDPGQAATLKRRWTERVTGLEHAREVAVLDMGATFEPLQLPPEEAQFLETQRWGRRQVATLFGVPPHLLGDVEASTSWGTGIEQQNIGLAQFTLIPGYLRRVEQAYTKHVLAPGNRAEHQVQGLLRGDAKTRARFYEAMSKVQALMPNEIRRLENLPPRPGGDDPVLQPGQTDGGGDAGAAADALRSVLEELED